jgi:rod shape-determining protein MreD
MTWQSLLSHAGRGLWMSLPFAVASLATLATMAPVVLFDGLVPAPNFALIAVFYWTIYGPQFFPPPATFALGLLMDLMGAGPIGFWPTVLLSFYGLTHSQRVFFIGRSLLGVWAGFALFAVLAGLASWALICIYYGGWSDPAPLAAQTAATAAAFPIAGRVLQALRRALTTAPERQYA